MNQNLAPVLGIWLAFDEASGFQPIGQLHNRVMPQDQPAGQLADSRPFSLRQSLESQQGLMLLWLEIMVSSL